jgi:UbiD family decarboxylase
MSVFDLRQWLTDAEQAGELQHVLGADPVLDIGAASQLNYRRRRPRALLFDEIAGHEAGQRVLTSSLSSPALMGMSLGLGACLDDQGLAEALRGRPARWAAEAPRHAAIQVDGGPVLEHVSGSGDINLLSFPCPLWHELDGGRYIGTGCAVVTSDPDTGVVNVGAYRIQVQDGERARVRGLALPRPDPARGTVRRVDRLLLRRCHARPRWPPTPSSPPACPE